MSGTGQEVGRLAATLERLERQKRVGLMTHIVLGYPDLDASRAIVDRMVAAGVDMVEVQIPFSDPTADGPVITAASQHALDRGVRLGDAMDFMSDVCRRHPIPFFFMSYFNILFSYRTGSASKDGQGVRAFARDAAGAGASGLIVPDIPPEQRQERYPEACREFGLHPIYVVSPNTPARRLQAIGEVASGFLYATSRTGTTGKEMELETKRLEEFLATARTICRLPLAVGFSISRRDQVEALRGHADIAVVGTHLIRTYESAGIDGVEREIRALVG